MSGDYDPQQVAIRPAATVMLVKNDPESARLCLLMMQRNSRTIFAGGMWVFPGGRVDPEDAGRLPHNHDAAAANQQLGLKEGAMAFYVAAIREAFEEAGVLLASRPNDPGHVSLTSDDAVLAHFSRLRSQLNAGELPFTSLLDQEDLTLCTSDLHYVARWITPAGPPRRFDTRFFLARMPADQTPLHDDAETVHSAWLEPGEILSRAESGAMTMMSPTATMVRLLGRYRTADEVIQAVHQGAAEQRVRVDGNQRILMPGEAGYAGASEEVEFGWVRLQAGTGAPGP